MIQSRCYLSSRENRKCNRNPKRKRWILTTEMRIGTMEKVVMNWVLKKAKISEGGEG